MLTLKESIAAFKKFYPDLKITDCAEYKKDQYLFAGSDKFTYRVDRNTGNAYPFSPMEDLAGFQEAIQRHKVKLK